MQKPTHIQSEPSDQLCAATYRRYTSKSTMVRRTKRNNPSGTNDKQISSRLGAKTKQTKVTPAKEMDPKPAQQTKLTFANNTNENGAAPPTPIGRNTTANRTAVTPEQADCNKNPAKANTTKNTNLTDQTDPTQMINDSNTTRNSHQENNNKKQAATNKK